MCGRYAASRSPDDLVEEFEVEVTDGPGPGQDPSGVTPDFNVAPTKQAPVVLERRPRAVDGEAPRHDDATPDPAVGAEDEDGDPTADAAVESAEREATRAAERRAEAAGSDPGEAPTAEPLRYLRLLTWGLVPSWAKDRSVGSRMINARAEGLLDKPAFRRAALARRCLVPVDGWYEWQKSPVAVDAKGRPRKQPFFIRPYADEPAALAGLYEFWRDPELHPDDPAAWLTTYTIVTTQAEPGLDTIHDRMPLVLPRDRWDDWLDPDNQDPDAVRALLEPPIAGRFCPTPVSPRVNAVTNNGPELVQPLPLDQLHGVVDPATGELLGSPDAPLF